MSIRLAGYPDCVFYDEGELPFTDVFHLYNHLNYLFRTDKGQKWTNERTERDFALFDPPVSPNDVSSGKVMFSDRQTLHDAALDLLKKEYSTTNLATAKAYKSLFMVRFYVADADEVPEVVSCLQAGTSYSNRGRILLAVAHEDQEEPFDVHLVFRWRGRKPRGRSRLECIIDRANELA